MGKPHKHAEVIKAWADGAKIQFRVFPEKEWEDLNLGDVGPAWTSHYEYRVKPKNKEVEMFVQNDESKFTTTFFIPNGIHRSNVRFTFSPEGELLYVEKI